MTEGGFARNHRREVSRGFVAVIVGTQNNAVVGQFGQSRSPVYKAFGAGLCFEPAGACVESGVSGSRCSSELESEVVFDLGYGVFDCERVPSGFEGCLPAGSLVECSAGGGGLLAATTGMRRGEILGLRWSDVDLEAGAISVRQIRTVARSKVITLTPKTERGARTIAVDPQTIAALDSYRVLQIEERLRCGPEYHDAGGLVFTQADGSAIHPERFSSWFKRRCQESGLPRIRLHDVRHSYVTALLAAGVPLKVVSQRIGHSSPVVTMTIYQHVLPGDDRAAAALGANAILGTG